ncbi:hypothetical protein ACTGYY_11505, partial [Streptococcus suis]
MKGMKSLVLSVLFLTAVLLAAVMVFLLSRVASPSSHPNGSGSRGQAVPTPAILDSQNTLPCFMDEFQCMAQYKLGRKPL